MFDSVEDVIDAIRRGEIVVIADDETRENEGDLVMAAEKVVKGLEIEVIRLQYLTIRPCIGCWKCANPKIKEWRCVYDKTDHMSYLVKKMSGLMVFFLVFPPIVSRHLVFSLRYGIGW